MKINKEKFKKHMLNKNLTQSELAKELGATQGILSLWINGKSFPSPKFRKAIIKAFGLKHFKSLMEE